MKKFAVLMVCMLCLFLFAGCRGPQESCPPEDLDSFSKIQLASAEDSETSLYQLTAQEQKQLQALLLPEEWRVAKNLPAFGFTENALLQNEAEDSLFVNVYGEETLLILKRSASPDTSICYFAPAEVAQNLADFRAELIAR